MTHDDIIRMAREAGFDVEVQDIFKYKPQHSFIGIDENIERFVALVAAAEREACAKLCEEIKCGMWEESKKHRDTRLRDASDGAGVCIYAIRARGESK